MNNTSIIDSFVHHVNAPGFCVYNALSGGIGSKGNAGTIGMGLDIFSLGPECLLYEIDETPGVLVMNNRIC